MRTSTETNELSAALAAAQGQMKNPEKNRTATIPMKSGGVYSYDYADLPSTIDAVRKALAENGLSHTAAIDSDDGRTTVSVRIMHASGQWIESTLALPPSADVKALAGNITYYRRYLLTALVGVAADDDMDSEPEAGATYQQRTKQPRPAPQKPVVQVAQPQKEKPVVSKPHAPESLEDYVPTTGRLTGQRLGDKPTAELQAYAAFLEESIAQAGKTIDQLPDAQREAYEKLMALIAKRNGEKA